MVVRAARAEVHSAKSWRRPAFGPGSRSRSADPRLRLDPLTRNNSFQAEPRNVLHGHENVQNEADDDGRWANALKVSEPPPSAPKRSGHRPASRASHSVGARLTPEPTSCSIPVEAPNTNVPSSRNLLRKREPSSSSSSPSPSPAFDDVKSENSEDCIDDLVELARNGDDLEDDFTYDENSEKGASHIHSECGSDDEMLSWDPEALAKELSDLPELQAIDEIIAAKKAALREIEAKQAILSDRLATSEHITRETHKLATHLKASLALKEAELDFTAPHHAPRCGAIGMPEAPPLESLRPTQLVDDDDTSLSQVRSAMGLLDLSKST